MDRNTDLYREIFSSYPHATVLFGLSDGAILDVNDAALSLYGYGRDEMIGLSYSALSADPEAKVHKRKDGSTIMIEAQRSTFSVEGREVGVAVIREIPVVLSAQDLSGVLLSILSRTEMALAALPAADPARMNLEEVRRLSLRAANLFMPIEA